MKCRKKVIFGLTVLVAMLVCDTCFAYFGMRERKTPDFEVAKAGSPIETVGDRIQRGSVLQLGTAKLMEKASSQGDSLPLSTAVQMIVPTESWKILRSSEDSDVMAMVVSWKTDGTWVESLDSLGNKYGIRFIVNWTTRKIFVEKAKGDGTPKLETETKEELVSLPETAEPGFVSVVQEKEPLPKAQAEILGAGNLEEILSAYVSSHQHVLAWDVDPKSVYVTQYSISLPPSGTFLENLKLIEDSLNSQGMAIKIQRWANDVIQVADLK